MKQQRNTALYAEDILGNHIYRNDLVAVATGRGSSGVMTIVEVVDIFDTAMNGKKLAHHDGTEYCNIKGVPIVEGTRAGTQKRDGRMQTYQDSGRMVLVERRSVVKEDAREKAMRELLEIAGGTAQ